MDDGLRTLLQVKVEQAALADEVVSILMGDDVELPQAVHRHQRQGRPVPGHLMSDQTPPEPPDERRRPRPHRHRADRDPGGDGALLPRLRDVGHHGAGAARRPRRPQAGAPPDPLGHGRPRRPPRPLAHEVRPRHRRRDGQVPPPRRGRDLRRPRAHGPGLLAAPPAGRRPRQLRRRPTSGRPRRATPSAGSAPLAMRMLDGIDEDTVDFSDNYSGEIASPSSCRPGSRTCSSTAARASRSAWPPTSRPTTWARSSTPPST